MKISIARLKEIIMEEVARATMEQKEERCQPGQTWEGDEMGQGKCVDLNEEDDSGSEEHEEEEEMDPMLQHFLYGGKSGRGFSQKEALDIEIVDDE